VTVLVPVAVTVMVLVVGVTVVTMKDTQSAAPSRPVACTARRQSSASHSALAMLVTASKVSRPVILHMMAIVGEVDLGKSARNDVVQPCS